MAAWYLLAFSSLRFWHGEPFSGEGSFLHTTHSLFSLAHLLSALLYIWLYSFWLCGGSVPFRETFGFLSGIGTLSWKVRPIDTPSSQGDSVRNRCIAPADAGTVSESFSALRRSSE